MESLKPNGTFGTIPCFPLGAQITPPPPLFLIYLFFLILAPAGGFNFAGPLLNLFPHTAG